MNTGTVTTFSGLASGLDTAAILEQLVALERRPIQRLQQKQADLRSMASRVDGLRGRLTGLLDAARELGDRDNVLAAKASSSDESVVKASTRGEAAVGTFSLEVTQLAQAEKTVSNGFAARDQTGLFGTGTLDVTLGGTTTSITVDSSDTLDTLADKITQQVDGVSASVVYDGSSYRLLVAGEKTGADQAIDFTETGVSLGLSDPANELRSAQDAVFSIDGLQMTRSSNTVSDALDGLTLELSGTTAPGSSVTVSVERDVEAITETVQGFVDAFNAASGAINAEFVFRGEGRVGDTLSGDPTLRRLQGALASAALETVSGASPGFDRLRSLGIELQKDGTLSLDETKLADALKADPDAVATFFAGDLAAGVQGFADRFEERLDPYERSGDGFLAEKAKTYRSQSDNIDDQIERLELRVDKFEETLRAQFVALEDVMSTLQSQSMALLAMVPGMASAAPK